MSISLIVSGAGALVVAAGLVMLLVRLSRGPRGDLIAWAVALFGLVASLAAQAYGHEAGFTGGSFRVMEAGAGVLAPLALIMGLSEAVARSTIGKFAARLLIPAFAVIPLVIFATDPLSGTAFSTAWPQPTTYYQLIPNKLAEFGVAPATIIVAIVTVGIAIRRSGREFAWRAALAPVTAVGVAVLALAVPALAPAIRDHLGARVPLASLFAVLCLVAGALTWYAGVGIGSVPADALRDGSLRSGDGRYGGSDRGPYPPPAGADRSRSRDRARDGAREHPRELPEYEDAAFGSAASFDSASFDSGPQDDRPPPRRAVAVDQTGDIEAIDAAALRRDRPAGRGYPAYSGPRTGDFAVAVPQPEPEPESPEAGAAGASAATREELFGQIAIYTLIEDQVEAFDKLTERVVGQVRSGEPSTLVFIVHAVPTAPMQRILYEVYRDRAAYDWHLGQAYVARFEEDRRPYVLATNVIELGLQHAKVSPFPSVAELLGEPAYDTSGFERPDFTREYGSTVRDGGAA